MERFAIKIDKNLRANLYKICRLCGIDNPEKVKILDDDAVVNLDDGEPELWKKVLDCVGLLVSKDDKMPQFMCTLCVDKINDFHEFREMCYATDVQTRKLLGIKGESKQKVPTVISSALDVKKEDKEEVCPQRPSRKRRNADMEVCGVVSVIKADEIEDVKPPQSETIPNGPKKKRIKMDKNVVDTKIKSALRLGPILGLSKKRLKIEPVTKEKKDAKTSNTSRFPKRAVKTETKTEGRKPLPLQIQKRKMAFERLKQRKLAKKIAVVKVEKLKKSNIETKVKDETAPICTPTRAPVTPLPKVKLKDKCAICKEGFVNKVLLDKHLKSNHVPSVVRYHCVHCNETLKKNMEIKNHNLWHKLSKTPFRCGNCSETSCSIYTYTKHIRDCSQVAYLEAHTPDWHCPDCKDIFETTYLFNIHSCVSRTLVCPGCEKSFKWQEDYLKHIPTCPAAIHRIPPYMSPHIQVKNEAELPSSPIPQQSSTTTASQASRITPPLMDTNLCVVIPRNVSIREEAASPSKSTGKKSTRITKKDLKRFDELLKSTMTTLVSIKKEPNVGEENEFGSPSSPSNIVGSPSGSPAPMDGDFHNHDTDNDSMDVPAPSQHIKQEIIDEGYRDLYNNIEVNIKREVILRENKSPTSVLMKKRNDCSDEQADMAPVKPVLKLKITKEHGTLNSILLDSPKSEKKKKKKKRKEEKHKPGDKIPSNTKEKSQLNSPEVRNTPKNQSVAATKHVEQEPVMPLPEIVHIKKEITESEEKENIEQLSSQSVHGTPSIVAATSGSLQISCVSEGVLFSTTDEVNEEHHGIDNSCVNPDEEIDVKPRLEDLTPMLEIASVVSGAELSNENTTKKQKSPPSLVTTFTTPQIVSISSGSEVLSLHPVLETAEEHPGGVDSNKNAFDYGQIKVKQEIVDPTYDTQDLYKREMQTEAEDWRTAEAETNVNRRQNVNETAGIDTEPIAGDDPRSNENSNVDEPPNINEEPDTNKKASESDEAPSTSKELAESTYIANIDFENLHIKQEKEYIDDGQVDFHDEHDDSNTESDSSSDSEDVASESDREYRDLPSDNEDAPLNTIATTAQSSFGFQIATVHSEFHCSKLEEKTDFKMDVENGSENKITSQPTVEFGCPEPESSDNNFSRNHIPESSLIPKQVIDKAEVSMAHSTPKFDLDNQPAISGACFRDTASADFIQQRAASGLEEKTLIAESVVLGQVETILHLEGLKDQREKHDPIDDSVVTGQRDPTMPSDLETITDMLESNVITRESSAAMLEPKMTVAETDELILQPNVTRLPPNVTALEPNVNSLKPNLVTVEPHLTTLESNITPIESNSATFEPNLVTFESNATSLEQNLATSEPNVTPLESNLATFEPNSVTFESNATSLEQNLATSEPNVTPLESNLATFEPNSVTFESNATSLEQNLATSEPNVTPLESNLATFEPNLESNSATFEPNSVMLEPNVTSLEPSTTPLVSSVTCLEPNLATLKPNAVTMEPNLATFEPNVSLPESNLVPLESNLTALEPNLVTLKSNVTLEPNESTTYSIEPKELIAHDKNLPVGEHASTPTVSTSQATSHLNVNVNLVDSLEANKLELSPAICLQAESNTSAISALMSSASFSDLSQCSDGFGSSDIDPVVREIDRLIDTIDDDKLISGHIVHHISEESNTNFEVTDGEMNIEAESANVPTSITDLPILTTEREENIDAQSKPISSPLSLKVDTLQDCSVPCSSSYNNELNQIPVTSATTSYIPVFSESNYFRENANLSEVYTSTSALPSLDAFRADLHARTDTQQHHPLTPLRLHLPLTTSYHSPPHGPDLNVPILSEEVQNLLNESTAAVSTFELNDHLLQAGGSSSACIYSPSAPSAVLVPNFRDLENVNEIAENNNNANIERELQDELGNVLAAAIANRSPDSIAESDNVINENRANFDLT